MPELVRTAKVGNQHVHFAYLTDPDQMGSAVGITSVAKGHRHQVEFRQAQEAAFDPITNEQAGSEAGWFVLEADGHTHELGGVYDPGLPDRKVDDKKLVMECLHLYHKAKDREQASLQEGREADDLYTHKQWDQSTKDHLERQQRAAVTVNKVESKVDNLVGYQRQNRTDIKYLPNENGDQVVADVLNMVSKNLLDQCYWGREESCVFEDSVVAGRGVINVYMDFTTNILGDIKVERFPWDDVMFGPHEKVDLSDCDYLVKSKWYSKNKLQEMYPEVEVEPEGTDWEEFKHKYDADYGGMVHGEASTSSWEDDFVNVDRKQYRMIEVWKKEHRRVHVLVNPDDGFYFAANGWSKSDLAAVKTIPGIRAIPRVIFKMRVTRIAGDKLLEDDYPDLAYNDFHVIPVYAKYRNGRFHGKIRGVKDLQLLVNKSYSQFIDIINKVANYGWFYDNETFPSERERQQWERFASTPGFNIKLNDVKKPPEKVEGQRFPAEIVAAIEMFNNDMREIMNINLEMIGQSKNDSGVALRQKIVQQLIGNDFLFDNLSFAKKKLGRILVSYIQRYYSAERIMRILGNEAQQGGELAGQKISEYDPAEIHKLLQEKDLSQYDVVVSESQESPSAMMGNFLLLLDMASKGIPIPPTAIIDFAPLPNKNKILEQIAQQQQQEFEREQMKYSTEIQKAQIAQHGNNQGVQ